MITQVGGAVSRVVVVPGEQVTAGQPLLYVASPDYSVLRSAYIKARDAFQLADKFYPARRISTSTMPLPKSDLEQAESTRAQAQADLESSDRRDPRAGDSRSGKNCHQARFTGNAAVFAGSRRSGGPAVLAGAIAGRGGTQCFTLSDMSSVWILVNIYQNDLPYVHVGDTVTVANESYPDVVHGKIEYISPALDPNTRTLQARIEAPNPGERLKKEMYVTAEVRAGRSPTRCWCPIFRCCAMNKTCRMFTCRPGTTSLRGET